MGLINLTLHRAGRLASRETRVELTAWEREGIAAWPEGDELVVDNVFTQLALTVDGTEVVIYNLHDDELRAIGDTIASFIGQGRQRRIESPTRAVIRPYPAKASDGE